jgi:hypothetical protein
MAVHDTRAFFHLLLGRKALAAFTAALESKSCCVTWHISLACP